MKLSKETKSKRKQRGAVTAEMGMVLPLLLLLFVGTIDMSRAMMAYSTLTHASQKAARFACVRSSSSDAPASAAQIKARALQHVVGLDPSQVGVDTTYLPTNAPGGVVQVSSSLLIHTTSVPGTSSNRTMTL